MTVLKKMKILLNVSMIICFILSGIFFYKAYDVKNQYHNSENFSSYNKNAYVGGDAYNYIINGTYFTGYSVIASAILLCGLVLMSNSIIITIKIKEQEDTKDQTDKTITLLSENIKSVEPSTHNTRFSEISNTSYRINSYERNENDNRIIKDGGWKCRCGRINSRYTGTCACGIARDEK